MPASSRDNKNFLLFLGTASWLWGLTKGKLKFMEKFPVGHHEFWDRCCWSGMKDSRECCCVSSNTIWAEVLSSFSVRAYSPINAEILSHGFELGLRSTLYSECCTDIRWFIFTTLLCKNYPQFRDKKRKWLSEDSGWELFLIAKLLTFFSFGPHDTSLPARLNGGYEPKAEIHKEFKVILANSCSLGLLPCSNSRTWSFISWRFMCYPG